MVNNNYVNVKSNVKRNGKRTRKARLRLDRVVGATLIVGSALVLGTNLFTSIVVGATTKAEVIKNSVKEAVKSVEDVDVYKVKVDFNEKTSEATVNLVMGTSYYELYDVKADGYVVANNIVNMLENKFDGEIDSCKFDIDVKVLMSGYSVDKPVADFEVPDLKENNLSNISVDDFKNCIKNTSFKSLAY